MLPVQLAHFVGRSQELATVEELLGRSRLLTLTGAGGSGKTRLALALLTQGVVRSDVAWVELASLTDADALPAHLATTLGVRADGGVTAERAMLAMLRDREMLLVLDNCEHLVEPCARLVSALLQGCPRLRVLATSREALGVSGERSWLVPPLALPAAEPDSVADALACESIELFVTRAQDVVPGFTLTPDNVNLVAQICRRLDGLPLAIELAAARVNILTPRQIAERLDDRFALLTSSSRTAVPRQRTLRAAVDWSYDLLSEPERLLLERLSVFAGGFTLDLAERVCSDDEIPASDVLELLASLTTRSLVAMQESQGRARYRLLETIREYAGLRAQLRDDHSTLRTRHATCILELTQEAAPSLILGRAPAMAQLDAEHDNVRAALAWSASQRSGATIGLPLCWATLWYWFHRQRWREGFRYIEGALATADDPDESYRAAALHGLALFGLYFGAPNSRERLAEAEAIWRRQQNDQWLTYTLLVRTVEASLRESPVEARGFADATVEVGRLVPDVWHVALALAHALVPVLLWEGDYDAAAEHLTEAERIYRERDYGIGVAYVLDARAFVALMRGDVRGAVALACASVRDSATSENRWLAGRSLRILGAAAMRQSDDTRAATLYGAADAIYESIAARSLTAERRAVNDGPAQLQTRMPPAGFAAAWDAGRSMSLVEAVEFALEADRAEPVTDGSAALPQLSVTAELALPTPVSLSVRVLGSVEICVGGEKVPADAWRYAKPRELLLYLLLHPGGRTREQIGLDFWPELSTAQVKNNFHVTLHHLRKAVGRNDIVRYERDRYRAVLDEGIELDAARFEGLVTDAMRTLASSPTDQEALRRLDEAMALHRGPLLETETVGDWHLEIRDRIARLYVRGLQALGTGREALGDHAGAAEVFLRALQDDALDEDVLRRYMLALARDGRRAEALRRFDRFRVELARELDAEPAPETERLVALLRQGAAI